MTLLERRQRRSAERIAQKAENVFWMFADRAARQAVGGSLPGQNDLIDARMHRALKVLVKDARLMRRRRGRIARAVLNTVQHRMFLYVLQGLEEVKKTQHTWWYRQRCLSSMRVAVRELKKEANWAALNADRSAIRTIERTTAGIWLRGSATAQAVAAAVMTSGSLTAWGWLNIHMYYWDKSVTEHFALPDYLSAGVEAALQAGWGLLMYAGLRVWTHVRYYTERRPTQQMVLDRMEHVGEAVTVAVAYGVWLSMWKDEEVTSWLALSMSVYPGVLAVVAVAVLRRQAERLFDNAQGVGIIISVAALVTAVAYATAVAGKIRDWESHREFTIETMSQRYTHETYRLLRGSPAIVVLEDRATGSTAVLQRQHIQRFEVQRE